MRKRHRLDARPGKPRRDIGNARSARFDVDGHSDEGVDQRERVRPGAFRDAREQRNVRDVGRELDEERIARGLFYGCNDFLRQAGVAAIYDAAAARVGAGNIQFVGRNAFAFIQDFDAPHVIFRGISEHIHHGARFQSAQEGQLLTQEPLRAHVLKADGVQHSRVRFINARRRIALHGFRRNAFHANRAKLVEVDQVGEFFPVAKRPAGRPHRVLEPHAGDLNFQLRREFWRGGCGGRHFGQNGRVRGVTISLAVSSRWFRFMFARLHVCLSLLICG